ncbi:MAG: UDP-N-acetylglucosamine--N-acetylmuramyl-(pentapeptide) pyrophosphoryl-undecaprenol N-acetylglucosamine transferase, partial [bacterium]
LIAVQEYIKKQFPNIKFLFVGTYSGPEKQAVESYKIVFKAIASGRLRRYFSWRNITDPFLVIWGFLQSLVILIKFKPSVVMIAGAFVGVPVAWAAWLLGIPVVIHQQDILPGLANKLMQRVAKRITVSFDISLNDYLQSKVVLTGNPVREEFLSCDLQHSRDFFNLKSDLPVLLVLGGGTGAQIINESIVKALAELLQFCQVIHITGKGKAIRVEAENYHQFEFLSHEMPDALCAADVVVSRAGLSTLTELIAMAKPTILVPIPGHQEDNALFFQKNNAVTSISQDAFNSELIISLVKDIMFDKARKDNLSRNISKMMEVGGAEKVAAILLSVAK